MTNIPTLNDLYNRYLNNLQTNLSINISVLGKIFVRALAATLAGMDKLIYLRAANLQQNIFIDTAQSVTVGGTLERYGFIKLGRLPFSAVAGNYRLTVTGTVGATVPALTVYKSDISSLNPNQLYILDNAYTLVSSPDTIIVRALSAGVIAKLNIANTLTATAPIAGVTQQAVVAAETLQPLASETLEEYRTAGIAAYRLEPQGGASSDYRRWSSDAQGVKNVYPYARSGYSTQINLFVEAVIADSTDGKGTPSGAMLTAVQAVVEQDPVTGNGRRPMNVIVNYLPINPRTVNINIPLSNYTAAQQTSIINALTAAINLMRPFVAGADVLTNKNDILDTNTIISVILQAQPGTTFGAIALTVDATPFNTFTFLNGDIPFVNAITFV